MCLFFGDACSDFLFIFIYFILNKAKEFIEIEK
jgi:hypothetical protein